jgi:hypothetical protein
MKKSVCIMFVFFMVFAVSDIAVASQKPPKLECKKIVLKMVKAFEERDFRTFQELALQGLTAQEVTDELVGQFKQEIDAMEEQGILAPILESLRNYPEIGEIPDWVTRVTIEYRHVVGDRQIELESGFTLKDGAWKAGDFDRNDRGDFENEKEWILENSIPAAPGDQKTSDAGFNEVVNRVLTAIKEGDDGTLTELTPLSINEIQGEKEKYIQLLSQFPKIGPVPAPLIEFEIKLESENSELSIDFKCPENKLKIVKLEVF